jgi:hypothetical protein
MFGYSIICSAVVFGSAGCLVFNRASAILQIFVFVRNKTYSSFWVHLTVSGFNHFCFVNQQRI